MVQDTMGAFVPGTDVDVAPTGTGPLDGLTFAAKDLFDIAGHVTGCGNPDWARTHAAAETTAPQVAALLNAGGRLIGKTITDELAFSLAGENHHYGTPLNPAAPDRQPGGSSSGSASAVAGGLCDFALGTDTGGSVRAPASYCGIYGLRPTHGAIGLDGVMPLAPSFDTVGWFTRDAGLLRRVGEVLLPEASTAPADPVLYRCPELEGRMFAGAHAAALPHLERIMEAFGSGAEFSLPDPTGQGLQGWLPHFQALQWGEVWDCHGDWVTATNPSFGPGIRERFEGAAQVTADTRAVAAEFREQVTAELVRSLGPSGVIVVPPVPDKAMLKGQDTETVTAFRNKALGMLCVSGQCRLPQLSMPLATVDGAPLGISLIGAPGSDHLLLQMAERIAQLS